MIGENPAHSPRSGRDIWYGRHIARRHRLLLMPGGIIAATHTNLKMPFSMGTYSTDEFPKAGPAAGSVGRPTTMVDKIFGPCPPPASRFWKRLPLQMARNNSRNHTFAPCAFARAHVPSRSQLSFSPLDPSGMLGCGGVWGVCVSHVWCFPEREDPVVRTVDHHLSSTFHGPTKGDAWHGSIDDRCYASCQPPQGA